MLAQQNNSRCKQGSLNCGVDRRRIAKVYRCSYAFKRQNTCKENGKEGGSTT